MAMAACAVASGASCQLHVSLNGAKQSAQSADIIKVSQHSIVTGNFVGERSLSFRYSKLTSDRESLNRRTISLVHATDSATLPSAKEMGLILVDHFARLRISRGASNAEIVAAYDARCKEVTEQQGLDEDAARQQLKALETSFNVLTSEEEKRLYLWGLMQKEQPGTYAWPYEADPSQSGISGTPPPMEAEDEEGTTLLGYFFVGWFALSIILSLTLK